MPYRFLEEVATADVAFEAWGKNREELFVASAAALLHTMVDDPQRVVHRTGLTIKLEHEELDLLLFLFLQELLFYKDARQLLLHADLVNIETRGEKFCLQADVGGEKIAADRHRLLVDVKAVTLHKFNVVCDDRCCRATVVLDV